jgi:RNA polymerase sigma factor (sigma-70 family)
MPMPPMSCRKRFCAHYAISTAIAAMMLRAGCSRSADVVSLEAEEEFGNAVATSVIDAEALLESRSDLRRLDQLIEALPVPLRETIVLRELHELGYRQIAEVTGVPIGTVMSRLHRARYLLFRAWDTTDIAERTDRQARSGCTA